LSWAPGTGDNRLYPYHKLKGDGPVYLMGGEFKALLANQMGLRAVCATAGEGHWKPRFSEHFRGQDVVICYDIDEAGRRGALTVANHLIPVAKTVRVIELPITEPPNGDFADYVLRYGHGLKDFLQLVEAAPVFTAQAGIPGVGPDAEPTDTTLSGAADTSMYFKKVRFKATVSGKDLTPFHVPRKVTLSCRRDQGAACDQCSLSFAHGAKTLEFSPFGQDALHMIRVHDSKQRSFIRGKAGIHASCKAWDLEKNEVFMVEELRAIPEIDFSSGNNEYVSRLVYSVAGRPLKANKSYLMTGVTVPEPNTQYVTQVVSEAEALKTSVDVFELDESSAAGLSVFKPVNGQTVRQKLEEICEDLECNVTRIYQRRDITLAILMAYYSALKFQFNGRMVPKGWLEVLVLGDTRTGKSETAQAIVNHLRLGEFMKGERASFAGLVGGMSQEQKRWHITWGKMPLNNRGLLVVDELSGLPLDTIADLSGVRSSGIAEITKIQTERTEAQTRLVCISNPRFNKKMEDFGYGVHGVRELIGAPEDVARFDFAVVSASGEVDLAVINARIPPAAEHKHTSELMNRLALWAWSRKPDQVEFTDGAVAEALKAAGRMGVKYSSLVPLVEPAEQRIKVARVSAAVAALSFSTGRSLQKLVVEREHVEAAAAFMEECYDKPSMGYDAFSALSKKTHALPEGKAERLAAQFVSFENWKTLKEVLLNAHRFRKQDLQDQIGYERDDARVLFRWLGTNGLVSSTPAGFMKQPTLTALLKGIDDEKPPRAEPLDGKESEI
jgi:hypothetical protein